LRSQFKSTSLILQRHSFKLECVRLVQFSALIREAYKLNEMSVKFGLVPEEQPEFLANK
jgi:hypothetical protein